MPWEDSLAKSPSHRLGQIVGDLLELSVEPVLREFCDAHGFYLDRKGNRPARTGRKVTWSDKFGNSHDLDFVIESDGTATGLGKPIGFVEVAWRRYTKHSRNKAQEIQGAILPLVETYESFSPFQGVVLGGVFTDSAIAQLRSRNFTVLYLSYETLVNAFSMCGFDIGFDEDTPTDALSEKVSRIEGDSAAVGRVPETLRELASEDISFFQYEMERKLLRRVVQVIVVQLFGDTHLFERVEDALIFVDRSGAVKSSSVERGFEVIVRYSNEDEVIGRFKRAGSAKHFLEEFR